MDTARLTALLGGRVSDFPQPISTAVFSQFLREICGWRLQNSNSGGGLILLLETYS